jgi:riboflavin kinase/FMN adenylyltransferase
MHVIHGFDHVPANARGAVLAIGNFDGVHRGHQALLAKARTRASAKNKLAGVMVFEPHPRMFFQPAKPHFVLTPIAMKLDLLERYRMDATVVLAFDAVLSALSAEAFVERVLVAGLGVGGVVVGYDFHFGKDRKGTPQSLAAAGREMGFSVDVVDQVAAGGEVASSSAIRAELAQGDVTSAAEMLGHWWRVRGRVIGGAKRGTGMGYPTANVALAPGTTLAHGIYATRVYVNGSSHAGAAYLGTRPTFDNGKPLLETFLLDFDADLYGREIEVEFIDRIRGDRKFDSSEALVAQMDRDIAQVRRTLAGLGQRDHFAWPRGV